MVIVMVIIWQFKVFNNIVKMIVKESWWQYSSSFTSKVISGKQLPQCRERVFKQKRFQFMLENVGVCYTQKQWILYEYLWFAVWVGVFVGIRARLAVTSQLCTQCYWCWVEWQVVDVTTVLRRIVLASLTWQALTHALPGTVTEPVSFHGLITVSATEASLLLDPEYECSTSRTPTWHQLWTL